MKRIIPVLLLQNGRLVKTVRFKYPKYIGDPLNALKIFNEKQTDEIIVLDIEATIKERRPDLALITSLAGECTMPLAYGGGIKTVEDAAILFNCGVEKIILNSAAFHNPKLISEIAYLYGSQSIIVSVDVRAVHGRYKVFVGNGKLNTHYDPATYAKKAEQMGAGEIMLTSIDREGTYRGYDTVLINMVARAVQIPVISCGGAANINDLDLAIKYGASAAAAGSIFLFKGKHQAVLINMPCSASFHS